MTIKNSCICQSFDSSVVFVIDSVFYFLSKKGGTECFSYLISSDSDVFLLVKFSFNGLWLFF